MAPDDIQDRIERALEGAGIHAAVMVAGGTVSLAGEVDTEEARQAAEDLVNRILPDSTVDNALEVQDLLPLDVEGFQIESGPAEYQSNSTEELASGGSQIEPSFMDQPVVTAAEDVADDQDDSFFPPTDPVIEPGDRDSVHVVGGFSGTSLDRPGPDPSASDGRIGDEALEEAVRNMLISDASTTDLNIRVSALDGVVTLEGGVEGIEDAENAEAVAASVAGVRDVIDRIQVAD
jgi:osmotically-inducible protein OsmY